MLLAFSRYHFKIPFGTLPVHTVRCKGTLFVHSKALVDGFAYFEIYASPFDGTVKCDIRGHLSHFRLLRIKRTDFLPPMGGTFLSSVF